MFLGSLFIMHRNQPRPDNGNRANANLGKREILCERETGACKVQSRCIQGVFRIYQCCERRIIPSTALKKATEGRTEGSKSAEGVERAETTERIEMI